MSSSNNENYSVDLTFSSKGPEYQKKIAQCLIQDQKWAESMIEIVDESYFTEKYLSVIIGIYFSYYKKYQLFPEINTLILSIKDELSKNKGYELLKRNIIEFLKEIKNEPIGADSVIIQDSIYKFCKRNVLSAKIVEMVKNLDKEDFDAEKIVEEMSNAIQIGHKNELGHFYKDELEKRSLLTKRMSIPTGTILDNKDVLNGGIELGQIAVIMAPSGVGKSMIMVALASNMLRQGLNVVFYTLEMSYAKIGMRFDANFSDIKQQEVYESQDNKDIVRKSLDEHCKGELVIAEYNSYELTPSKIRAHLKALKNKGFKADAIFIDYADLMAPNETVFNKNAKSYEGQGSNYFALRDIGRDEDLVVITASQTNRGGVSKDILEKSDIAEDFKKVTNADIIFGFTEEGILSIIKNRNGRSDHYYIAQYDWGTVKLEIMQEADEDLINLRKANKSKFHDDVVKKNLANYFTDKNPTIGKK